MPTQSTNAANLDAGLMRLESLPLGDSQIQPDYHYRQPEFLTPTEESHFEPAVTVLTMSLQWERLVAHERRRNRQLVVWISSLENQLRQADASYRQLKQTYERLCNGDNSPQSGWGQEATTAPVTNGLFPNGLSEIAAPNNSSSTQGSMPPPPPKEDISQGIKRKAEVTGGNNKRAVTRNLMLNSYDRPVSPKSLFSPNTPTAMKF